jgi:hypothetical protein
MGDAMAITKTTTLTFRIEPNLKEALRTAAEREHRSIANMIEVMIRDHCARIGVLITETPAPVTDKKQPAK